MAIIAPSFIPKTNPTAEMWGGISDIFGDITRMRESKRQIERQRIADAQSAASHASLERNRDQLHAQRAALEAERLKSEAEYAAYTGSDQQQLDKLAVEGFTPRTGKYLGVRGAGPGASINTMTTPTLRDRSDAELRFATQSRQKHLQNLNYIQTGLKTIESRAQAAIASGNADELAKLKIKYQEFQNAQKEVEARLAEDTEEDKRAYTGSQADTAAENAKWAKVRAESARRKAQLSQDQQNRMGTMTGVYGVEPDYPPLGGLNPDAGGFQRDPDRAVTGGALYRTRPGMESFEKTRKLYETAGGTWTDEQKLQAGLADAVTGKTKTPYDPLTKKQRQDTLSGEIRAQVEAKTDYDERAYEEDEIELARNNILKAARQLAIKSGDSSDVNVWRIASMLAERFDSGFKKNKLVDKFGWFTGDWQDYKPMTTKDIVDVASVPPQVTQRYLELLNQGKSLPQIKQILKSKGLIK